MPYEIAKVKGGYKVQKKGGSPMRNGKMYASNKALPLETAKKQMAALYVTEEKYKIYKFDGGYKVGRKDKNKLRNGRYYSTNKLLTYQEAKESRRNLVRKDREEYDSRR
jgi:hypothetical protein